MGTDIETRELFWEMKDRYRAKFHEVYGLGVGPDSRTLEDHIKIMEQAIKSGKPAPGPAFEGVKREK